jgi:hypothetical protein
LPDKSQRRILIFNEAECDLTGSGFFNFKYPYVIANPRFIGVKQSKKIEDCFAQVRRGEQLAMTIS